MSDNGELLLAELAKHEAGTCCCKHEPTFTTKCVIGALHPNGTSDLGIRDLRDRIVALERELAEAREGNRQLGQAHIDVSNQLSALREQRCETCESYNAHQRTREFPREDYCRRHDTDCVAFGHRCGAWSRREP